MFDFLDRGVFQIKPGICFRFDSDPKTIDASYRLLFKSWGLKVGQHRSFGGGVKIFDMEKTCIMASWMKVASKSGTSHQLHGTHILKHKV